MVVAEAEGCLLISVIALKYSLHAIQDLSLGLTRYPTSSAMFFNATAVLQTRIRRAGSTWILPWMRTIGLKVMAHHPLDIRSETPL